MGGFESAVYRELNYPDSIGIYTLGKSVQEDRNEWFDEILADFEDEGAEVEGYWLGLGEELDYDVEANVFEYDFDNPIGQDVKLLVAPKPSVYRFNGNAPGDNPLDNYRSLALKVDENLDSVMMKGLSDDNNGQIPSADSMVKNLGKCLTGPETRANMIAMQSRSTGEEALLVKSTKFPYNIPERAQISSD